MKPYVGRWSWSSIFNFLNQSLMWSLPSLLLPLLPPPVAVTVAFSSHPLDLQTPAPGRTGIVVLLQNCSQVPQNHQVASLSPPSLQLINVSTRAGMDGDERGWSSVLLLVSNSGQRLRGEDAGPTGTSTGRWVDFHFSFAHSTWSLPHSPNCSTPLVSLGWQQPR